MKVRYIKTKVRQKNKYSYRPIIVCEVIVFYKVRQLLRLAMVLLLSHKGNV